MKTTGTATHPSSQCIAARRPRRQRLDRVVVHSGIDVKKGRATTLQQAVSTAVRHFPRAPCMGGVIGVDRLKLNHFKRFARSSGGDHQIDSFDRMRVQHNAMVLLVFFVQQFLFFQRGQSRVAFPMFAVVNGHGDGVAFVKIVRFVQRHLHVLVLFSFLGSSTKINTDQMQRCIGLVFDPYFEFVLKVLHHVAHVDVGPANLTTDTVTVVTFPRRRDQFRFVRRKRVFHGMAVHGHDSSQIRRDRGDLMRNVATAPTSFVDGPAFFIGVGNDVVYGLICFVQRGQHFKPSSIAFRVGVSNQSGTTGTDRQSSLGVFSLHFYFLFDGRFVVQMQPFHQPRHGTVCLFVRAQFLLAALGGHSIQQ